MFSVSVAAQTIRQTNLRIAWNVLQLAHAKNLDRTFNLFVCLFDCKFEILVRVEKRMKHLYILLFFLNLFLYL